jgi:hypothetical protein
MNVKYLQYVFQQDTKIQNKQMQALNFLWSILRMVCRKNR